MNAAGDVRKTPSEEKEEEEEGRGWRGDLLEVFITCKNSDLSEWRSHQSVYKKKKKKKRKSHVSFKRFPTRHYLPPMLVQTPVRLFHSRSLWGRAEKAGLGPDRPLALCKWDKPLNLVDYRVREQDPGPQTLHIRIPIKIWSWLAATQRPTKARGPSNVTKKKQF